MLYWRAWVDIQKSDTKNNDASAKARRLNESFSVLGYIGLSAEARGMAANTLLEAEPITRSYPVILGFATTDPMLLRKTEEQFRSSGKGLETSTLPAEVIAEIAVSAIRKQSKSSDTSLQLSIDKLPLAGGSRTKDYAHEIVANDAAIKRVVDQIVVRKFQM